MSLVITSATSGIVYAGISSDVELIAALPLLLVIGVLYAIVVGHYLRQKDSPHSRKQKEDGGPGAENASEK